MARKQGDSGAPDECSKPAAQANRAHGIAQASVGEALGHALEAGEALLKARDRVGRGKWPDRIRSNCKFSARIAQKYMRLARAHQSLSP